MITSYAQDIYQLLCKKHPNKNIYVIGDQHFYHYNIIQYTRHEFSNVQEMNEYIIQNHNKIVGKEDVVILLGDFCFKNDYIKEALEKMNGHKYLMIGNHDSTDLVKRYPLLGIEGVFLAPVKIEDIYLSHEPLIKGQRNDLQFQLIVDEFKKVGHINYHGHIHTKDVHLDDCYHNATCEVLDYKPILIGKTKEQMETGKPLFINSSHFDSIITEMVMKHHIQPQLLLSDYIYSMVLESLSNNQNDYVVQGSFGLIKKYHFLTKMSDLDISFLYNTSKSKKYNQDTFKSKVDSIFETLKLVEGMNLSFMKRYVSLRIFEILYTSKTPYFTNCIVDSNLIGLDSYKETDFILLKEPTMIQQYLQRNHSSIISEYQFPQFHSQFLSPEGDLANLLLQLMYQQGFEDKKLEAFKRLKYVYKVALADHEMHNFDSILSRFFLKNIAFLCTTNRYDEIQYIQNRTLDISRWMYSFPTELSEQLETIIMNPNSQFSLIFDEISSTPMHQMLDKCTQLVKK